MKLTGKIVHGEGRGHGLGVPTINVDIHESELAHGVYAVKVGENIGAMNWGPRPTFDEGEARAEVHLLDFKCDMYGEEVEVEVFEKIRGVIKFDNKEELIKQIQEDIVKVRAIFL